MSPLAFLVVLAVAPGADPATEEFFETSVRPVLADHCYSCHGPDKQKGGVRLDGPDFLFKEIDGNEPLVKPKDVKTSRVLAAVRHEGDYPMPPKGKLTPAQIGALEKWVAMGAPWPAVAVPSKAVDAKQHWAFQPIARSEPPAGSDPSPIDRFVKAKLAANGLTLSAPADRAVWLRRVTFDLTGLPPTPEELSAFEQSSITNLQSEMERVVDRLLASPAYGERWGRHWLDVARYADTREAGFQIDTRYPFAWTYRDWVIRAFNADLPFDEFVVRQLAADRVVDRHDHPEVAALGFLTVGRRFSNGNEPNAQDMIDDQLDVICRGLMGLTVTCARCHDHKFDPIPTRDYYSLYAVFNGEKLADRPTAATLEDRAKLVEFEAEAVRRRQAWEDYAVGMYPKLFGGDVHSAKGYADSMMEWHTSLTGEVVLPKEVKSRKLSERRRSILSGLSKQGWHPVLGPWFVMAKLPPTKYAEALADIAETDLKVNPLVAALFRDKPVPATAAEAAARYGELFAAVDQKWRAKLDAVRKDGLPFTKLGDPPADEVLKVLIGADGFGYYPIEKMQSVFNGADRQKYIKLKDKITELRTEPTSPPHAMVVEDSEKPQVQRVFVRGNPGTPGPEVPRQFLAVATAGERTPFGKTNRLDLAKAVVSPGNPLTARVWANRVWGHLFGVGLVRTASDFGVRGDQPTHPELLDYLASEFVADGWSTKRLIRGIVLSRTYGQSSADRPEAFAKDPQNTLLWRMNRRRLDFEAYRDATLRTAGVLDPTFGGPAPDLATEPANHKRTVYTKVDRIALSALHRAFDFANPDLHTPARYVTTVPQQAVLLLNHPFAADAARAFAARVDKQAGTADPAEWVTAAYGIALGREPTTAEKELAVRFLTTARSPRTPEVRPVYWVYGLANWDREGKMLSGFKPLPVFEGDAWRDAAKAGKAQLTADGGRAMTGTNVVLVRRWVAPAAGKVRLDGEFKLKDPTAAASAVVVSSVRGVLDAWDHDADGVHTETDDVTVASGEALDFFVEPAADKPGGVEYDWRFTVEAVDSPAMGRMVWNSTGHFDGPPPPPAKALTVREQFAQVLLMTNEFATLD